MLRQLSAKLQEIGVSTSGPCNLTYAATNPNYLTVELESNRSEAQYEVLMVVFTHL